MRNLSTPIILLITLILSATATILWSVPIILAGILKLLLPFPPLWRKISLFCNTMMHGWCASLALILRLNPGIIWDVQGLQGLSQKHSYLLICNHRSWADIVVLCVLLRQHIPMNKYLLKRQLAWIPFLGLACWALDMPFMRRYSRAHLLRHPNLRDKDVQTTRRACEKLRHQPTTIVNFVEGSRFTEQKRQRQRAPYQHLLPPKAAGLAMALNLPGTPFTRLLNVTLYYPQNTQTPFFDLLSGKFTRIVIRIQHLTIASHLQGDYLNDKPFKRHFQTWLASLWHQKDQQLDTIKRQYPPE